MILPSHHPHLRTIVREMPRPVPASTHVAALERCHLPGADHRAGQRERPRHHRPARDLPEPWLSMLAHSHRKNTRTAPAGDGCAAAVVAFPELDGIRLAILACTPAAATPSCIYARQRADVPRGLRAG